MATIRLIQTRGDSPDHFRVRVEYEGDGARCSADAVVSLTMSERDHQDIRWYLEDYLEAAYEPEREIAAQIEHRMHELGEALFQATFQGSEDARDLWATARSQLADTRIEILTSVADAAALPWELLRDPRTDQPLALGAAEFVRVQSQRARKPCLPKPQPDGKVRILLAICRPAGPNDVAYRSVASRLVKGLTAQGRERVQLDILRPPTYARLAEVLRQAKENGAPYHVVHFDGHGLYADAEEVAKIKAGDSFDSHSFKGPDSGPHGYLAFEHPEGNEDAIEPIGGAQLGDLLYETGVPVLVLNACRSAYADSAATPEAGEDHHDMVQAYGSLAQEVVEQGIAGVVAMRYNVYVVTAAQFIADLYRVLAEGHSLGRAVTRGRKALNDSPARAVSDPPIPLQDWSVPVLYEAAPLHLFPKTQSPPLFTVRDNASMAVGEDEELPRPPDVGFFGRDETLLTLDRAFDRHSIALLHAYAGSGKTAAAAEFARWYRDTGGLGEEGLVLFDSFERHRTARDLVDKLGGVFAPLLQQQGIEWLTLNDTQRYRLSLEILKQIPVLWVWDNVEPVAGFPAGAESSWTPGQQRELADFLRDLTGTKAKILLTSRRDERAWLGDLPTRWAMPPMPIWERRALAEELIRRHHCPLRLVYVLAPLLRFSAGNPMTLTVVIGQALRDQLSTAEQVIAYVTKLRDGSAAFTDDSAQGRSRSLGASLDYGFQAAFSDEERCRLALLHLFQGFVDVNALRFMGNPDNPGCLDSLRDLTREAGIALLDRAAEIGLLMAHGNGCYGIHPAVPWFLKDLFDTCYPALARRAKQAYVVAIGELGNTYHNHFSEGHHQALGRLRAEEHNLLHARRLALAEDWWGPCYGAMQGLRILYTSAGQWAGWERLVTEAAPLVTAADGGPQPGREGDWSLASDYAVELAGQGRDEAEVERLLRRSIAVLRGTELLDRPVESLTAAERHRLRSLGGSLQRLGSTLMARNDPDGLDPLREAHDLLHRLGDRTDEAVTAYNIGQAYLRIDAVQDLAAAERWTHDSLALHEDHDRAGRARCHAQLGLVASARFEALPVPADPQERTRLLIDAEQAYQTALDLIPADNWASRAVMHHQLARVYAWADQTDAAMAHWKQSIDFLERLGNRHGAGMSRRNIACLLARIGRFSDALAYARAARADFAFYAGRAAADVAETDVLIAKIERDLAAS